MDAKLSNVSPEEGMQHLVESGRRFGTVLADPPWRFSNRTGKMAPEHRRLHRYPTMKVEEICALPVRQVTTAKSHLYLWVPNALLAEGLEVMKAWGFTYKTNLVWYKVRKDGGPDGRGVGFYFRNVTELLLFGIKGSIRTGPAGRRQVNLLQTRKEEHSKKPDEFYELVERCSHGPYLEMFARFRREKWTTWGNEVDEYVDRRPQIKGYSRSNGDDQPILFGLNHSFARKHPGSIPTSTSGHVPAAPAPT